VGTSEKRAEMKRAVRYRSGPGLMNTVYLGSLATAGLMRRLGGSYGGKQSLQECIDNATDEQIEKGWDYEGFQWILKAYRDAGSKLYEYEVTAKEVD